jgi:hypothetical protein
VNFSFFLVEEDNAGLDVVRSSTRREELRSPFTDCCSGGFDEVASIGTFLFDFLAGE